MSSAVNVAVGTLALGGMAVMAAAHLHDIRRQQEKVRPSCVMSLDFGAWMVQCLVV